MFYTKVMNLGVMKVFKNTIGILLVVYHHTKRYMEEIGIPKPQRYLHVALIFNKSKRDREPG